MTMTDGMPHRDPVPEPEVQHLTAADLECRRRGILARLGVSREELAVRAAARSLAGDEWAAWGELQEIEFLMGAL